MWKFFSLSNKSGCVDVFLQEKKLFPLTFFSVFLLSGLQAWNAVKNSEYAQNIFFFHKYISVFQEKKLLNLQELRNVERLFWKHFSHQTQERKQCRANWENLSLGAPVAEWGETHLYGSESCVDECHWLQICLCVSAAQPYVAIDWDPEMKKRFYNENEAEVSENTRVYY